MLHKAPQQRKAAAEADGHFHDEAETGGRQFAPPPFQLQASSIEPEKEEQDALQLKKRPGMAGFSPELSPPSSNKFHSDAVPQ